MSETVVEYGWRAWQQDMPPQRHPNVWGTRAELSTVVNYDKFINTMTQAPESINSVIASGLLG